MKQFTVFYIINGSEEFSIYFLFTKSEAVRALKKLMPEALIQRVEERSC